MKTDHESIRISLKKLRGLAFLISHFDVGASLAANEAEGIGAILDAIADEIESVVQ